MKKNKTLKQEAAESLNRSAGQYERHGRRGAAYFVRESVDRLLGEKKETEHIWKGGDANE